MTFQQGTHPYKILITKTAYDAFRQLPSSIRGHVAVAISSLANDPSYQGKANPLGTPGSLSFLLLIEPDIVILYTSNAESKQIRILQVMQDSDQYDG
jgi:mRNA-degrading endonuclease RelE of RelBE toxin-antitoxin system